MVSPYAASYKSQRDNLEATAGITFSLPFALSHPRRAKEYLPFFLPLKTDRKRLHPAKVC